MMRFFIIYNLRMANTLTIGSGQKLESCPQSRMFDVAFNTIIGIPFILHFL